MSWNRPDPSCAHTSTPDLWFSGRAAHRQLAAEICASCPVRERCLAEALRQHPVQGVWGGTSLADRERLLILAGEAGAPDYEVALHEGADAVAIQRAM